MLPARARNSPQFSATDGEICCSTVELASHQRGGVKKFTGRPSKLGASSRTFTRLHSPLLLQRCNCLATMPATLDLFCS
eukprot:scaffold827_cov36-Phaeocystis_antarctica.AAC.1